tara:strand:- start:1933 stop:2319 length:387 start_codon:yes stop_codon:yes gene_type:complete
MKWKVTKSGVEVQNITYDWGVLSEKHLPENGTPHWPYHMAGKRWVTNIDDVLDAQEKFVALFPDRFMWLVPDWRSIISRIVEKERIEAAAFNMELESVKAERGRPGPLTFLGDMVEAEARCAVRGTDH